MLSISVTSLLLRLGKYKIKGKCHGIVEKIHNRYTIVPAPLGIEH